MVTEARTPGIVGAASNASSALPAHAAPAGSGMRTTHATPTPRVGQTLRPFASTMSTSTPLGKASSSSGAASAIARELEEERMARQYAQALADEHSKSVRVLEVSRGELVRKMLSMKIELERSERAREASTPLGVAGAAPSAEQAVNDMRSEIQVTRSKLKDSNHTLAEESRKSAIAAQELLHMNRALRDREQELRTVQRQLKVLPPTHMHTRPPTHVHSS